MPSVLLPKSPWHAIPALAACALLHTSCTLLGPQGVRPPAAGTALEAFARDLGVSVAVRKANEGGEEKVESVAAVPSEMLAAHMAEGRAALARLEAAYGGAKPSLDRLPPARDRVSSLARARGLVVDFDRQPEARTILDAVLAERPGHVFALELRAESHRRSKDLATATRILRELAAAFPKQPRFRFQLATVLLENDGARDAGGSVGGASEAARSRVDVARARESALRAQREGERILASLVSGPIGVQASDTLCARLLRRFQPERAETVLRKALRARPGDPDLECLLGRALRCQGRFDEALGVLAPVAKSETAAIAPRARYEIIWCLRSLNRFDDAVGQLELLRKRPGAMASVFLDGLGKTLQEERQRGRRVSYGREELRFFLRKSEDRAMRENALEILMENADKVDGVESDFLHVLRRDSVSDLRARALVALLRLGMWNEQAIEIALHDVDPRNRRIAINRSRRVAPPVATRLLFEALCRESDPETFRAAHDRLGASAEINFFLVGDRAESPEGRSGVCDEWAAKLGLRRRGKKAPPGAGTSARSGADSEDKAQEKQK